MNSRLLARLETHVDNFLTENFEEDDWPDAYIHPKLKEQMAKAASAVFDGSVDGQEYAASAPS